MYVIRGFKKRSGEYQGRAFENYSLFCTRPDSDVVGETVATIKVKPAVLQRVFPDSSNVVGTPVDFVMEQRFYNGSPSVVVTDIKILERSKN